MNLPTAAQAAIDAAQGTGQGLRVQVDFEELGRQLGLPPEKAKAFAERSRAVAASERTADLPVLGPRP